MDLNVNQHKRIDGKLAWFDLIKGLLPLHAFAQTDAEFGFHEIDIVSTEYHHQHPNNFWTSCRLQARKHLSHETTIEFMQFRDEKTQSLTPAIRIEQMLTSFNW